MPATPNYAWPTPADTDYVKDGAAAIRALGDAIDVELTGFEVEVDRTGAAAGEVPTLQSDGTLDFGPGIAVVQIVTGVLTTYTTTTAATPQNSGLEVTITPKYADSVLLVKVDGELSVQRVAGTPSERRGWVEIFDATSAVVLARQLRGRTLVSGTGTIAPSAAAIALEAKTAPGNTTARTFRLRIESTAAVDVEVAALGTAVRTGGVIMTVMEVRP